jgi:hypothetical protein
MTLLLHCCAWYESTLSTSTLFGYVKFLLKFREFLTCTSRDYNLLCNNGYKYNWYCVFQNTFVDAVSDAVEHPLLGGLNMKSKFHPWLCIPLRYYV